MSSTSNAQDLLVNVFRPTYRWDPTTGFIPSLVVSNVTEVITDSIKTGKFAVSDANANTYIGCNAGPLPTNLTTSSNTAIGASAMAGASNSSNNVSIGTSNFASLLNSTSNVGVGSETYITGSGSKNILLGANLTLGDGSGNILIGTDLSVGSVTNHFQLGRILYGDLSAGYVGINTSAPEAPLDISGEVIFRNKVGIQMLNPAYTLDVAGTAYAYRVYALGIGGYADVPSFSFCNASNVGMYLENFSTLGFASCNGRAMTLGATKATIYRSLDVCGTISSSGGSASFLAASGTATEPAYSFTGASNLGLYRTTDSSGAAVAIAVGGQNRLVVGSNTMTMIGNLNVSGTFTATSGGGGGGGGTIASNGLVSAPSFTFSNDASSGVYLQSVSNLGFATAGVNRMSILNTGDVSAGRLVVSTYLRNTTSGTRTLDISGGNISNSGTTTSSNFIGTASASNQIGGVTLSNSTLRIDPSDGFLVAGGEGSATIATSPDGITWTSRTSPFSSYVWGVAWNGSLWVAVGRGTATIATSPDGITWTSRTSPFTSTVYAAAWNGSLWVVGGSGTARIATSPDGITWTSRTTPFTNSDSVFTVAWNGSLWVAGGSGTARIMTSPDGITWTGQTTPFTNSVSAVAWNGSLWVAGARGTVTIATSPDGITWTAQTSPFTTVVFGVAWNGSLWVAVGEGGERIATSPDGITWTGRLGEGTAGSQVFEAAWNGSLWVVGTSQTNKILTSPDGITWTAQTNPFTTAVYGVASRRYVLPLIRQASVDASDGTLGIVKSIVGYNVATSNQIGGVTLSNGALSNATSSSNSIGGVTLSNTNISYAGTITGSTANTSNQIGGVTLSNNAVTTATNAANSIGGVTLSNTNISYAGTITGSTANTSNRIGGVTLSNNAVTTATNAANSIGGVTLTNGVANGTFSNTSTTNNFIGGVRMWDGAVIASNGYVLANAGTNELPAFTFSNAEGTGLYQAQDASYGTGALAIAVNQSPRIVVMSNKTFIYGNLDVCGTFNAASGGGGGGGGGGGTVATDGTAGAPSFTFSNDSTTGMYLPSAGLLGLTAGGAGGLLLTSNGYLGVAGATPDAFTSLTVGNAYTPGMSVTAANGNVQLMLCNATNSGSSGSKLLFVADNTGNEIRYTGVGGLAIMGSQYPKAAFGNDGTLTINPGSGYAANATRLDVYGNLNLQGTGGGSLTYSGAIVGSTAGASNSIGGVTLSNGWISNGFTTENTIGGVTLSAGILSNSSSSVNTIGGVWLSNGVVSNSSSTTNTIGGISLSYGALSNGGSTDNYIGGVTLSNGSVVNSPSSSNNIGGVELNTGAIYTSNESYTSIGGVTLTSNAVIATSSTLASQIGVATFTSNLLSLGTTGGYGQLFLLADQAVKQSTSVWETYSDRRVKQNIQRADISLCYEIVKRLPLQRFTWDASFMPTVTDRNCIGWIAQDVSDVFPNAVSRNSNLGFSDFHTLNVDQLHKTMYGALEKVIADKEALEAQVAAQDTLLQTILARLATLGASPQSSGSTQTTPPTPPPPSESPESSPAPPQPPSSEYAPAPAATEA